MKDNIQKVINLSFRPLMGIILFNYPERTDLLVPAEVIRFRPLMGIILFNAINTLEKGGYQAANMFPSPNGDYFI